MEFLPKTTNLKRRAGHQLTARLIYDKPSLGELADFIEAEHSGKLQEKIKDNYEKKLAALSDRIKALEDQNKSPDDIKKALQKEKAKIIQEAINQALKDLKIQRTVNNKKVDISYLEIINHPDASIKEKLSKIYDAYEIKSGPDLDKAVDTYMSQKGSSTAKTTEALKAGLKPFDTTAANAETVRLQEMLDQRKGIISKSKGELAELKIDRSEAYRARTSMADVLTSPKEGIVDNYETDLKFWSKDVTNEKNPTRARLEGFLYANDIFSGGGEAGQAAMNAGAQEARKQYVDHWPDKLTMNDMESGMGMKAYFDKASQYSSFDRVIGAVAGLERLADSNISKPNQLKKYLEYIRGKFADLKSPDRKNDEEKQIQYLYSIQSFAEFIGADPNWKSEFNRLDKLTDPTQPNAKIDDYPGTGKDNKENKTRWQLNGYLFSVYLFNGRDKFSATSEFERAAKMFKDSGLIDEDFTQDMMEKSKEGKKDGFGLGSYLSEADQYTKHEQVKGVIAGLLKQAADISPSDKSKNYRAYLDGKFSSLSPADSEESQMTVLSTINSPAEAEKELRNELFSTILEAAITASKQHNQVALEKKFKDRFNKDPQTMSLDEINTLAKDVKAELDKFVKDRSDAALKGMQTKYDALVASNAKGTPPLFGPEELNPLAKSIEDNALEFSKAKGIQKEASLDSAINNKYLETLTQAEKNYFSVVEQLDAKQKAVEDQKAAKLPDQNNPLPDNGGNIGPVGPSGPETANNADPYLTEWPRAERVAPVYLDYQGPLIADGSASKDPVIARDENGNKFRLISNGTELTRTADDSKELARRVQYLNFIRVTDQDGKKLWICEDQLYRREDYNAPAKSSAEVAAQAQAAEKTNEKLKYGATYWDVTFNRLSQEVEASSVGSTFDFLYNGLPIACRAQKFPDGYHLMFNSVEAGTANLVFRNMQEMRNYCETGNVYQRLAMQTLLNRNNWDRFKDENWLDELTDNPKQTGDNSVYVELDWKRNNAFEKGNGKINLSVGLDGRINYTISKDHVGPNGENERSGFASDFTQLVQALNHCKNWSESYVGDHDAPEFPAKLEQERALAALMDARTFENMGAQIGEKYYFSNFYNFGYSFMTLNWDRAGDLMSRNRSLNNPIFEVRLNTNNTITWKLVNRTGINNAWVGTTGTARDMTDLAFQVENVKRDPAKSMTQAAETLPNLGALGYSLY